LYGAAVCIYKGKEKYRKQTLSHQKKSLEKQSVPCNEMLCKPDKAAAAVITAPKGIVMLQSISSCSKFIIRKSKFSPNPKRSVHFSSVRSKRSVQKGLARNTNNKARNKSQNHSISGLGFVKHNSTGNIIAFK
jgi:hypothetical protein